MRHAGMLLIVLLNLDQVIYDPKKISFVDLLRYFWESHDPTQGMGQGNDRGTQYRSHSNSRALVDDQLPVKPKNPNRSLHTAAA